MSEFVKLIEESSNGYVEKLKNAVELKIVRNLSRNMIKELISIYKLHNPDFDERMISCSSCPTSVLRFMVEIGTAYFNEKKKESIEVVIDEDEFFGIPKYIEPVEDLPTQEPVELPIQEPIDEVVITNSKSKKK